MMTPSLGLRVVSYNVLSSHLASPSHFSSLVPEHLEASARLPVVLKKLEDEIDKHSRVKTTDDGDVLNRNVIVCLQEVSHDWAGDLHSFFANKGYHMATGLYGKKFNGYMGVCLAWPTETLETIGVDISRLSDKRDKGWPEPEELSIQQQLSCGVQDFFLNPLRKLGLAEQVPPDHWGIAENRHNILLTATLKEKKSGKVFSIGNYHMPCAYYAPMVMSIHVDLAAAHVQKIASKHNAPCILAGDFNIKPGDSTYKLMTTGEMDKNDPSYPTPKNGFEWTPTAGVKPMKSAYAVASPEGKEPEFTNNARIGEQAPFVETLDYIFVSEPPTADESTEESAQPVAVPSWKVDGVLQLPKKEDAKGPFPNLEAGEPSDHLLIAADLSI